MIYEYFNWDSVTVAGLAWGAIFIILLTVAIWIENE